jgi:formate hydrogenlyase subunit 4
MDALLIVAGVVQAAAIVALAPLLTGVMWKVKARTQKRVGASVLQPYYNLSKLMKKDEVVSDQSSWVFRCAPWVMIAATVTAALFVPAFVPFSPFGTVGDVLVVIGLFGLARFFTMLAGLDVASAFGGLGTSREMMISSLAEPALFLSIFVVSLTLGGTNLSSLVGAAAQSAGFATAPSMLFALIAFFIVALAETGRLPFDNPATHLELTMVHEAMVLEYSGKSLAMIQWSQSIKQTILLALLVNLFIPAGMPASLDGGSVVAAGAGAFLAKVVLLAMLVAYVETNVAKWRLFRVPDLLVMAIASSMVGVIFYYL